MKGLTFSALALAIVAVLSTPAFAQRQGRGFGGGQFGGVGSLVRNESVQKELKLDQAQADKAVEAARKVQEKYADEFTKLRDMPQEERRAKSAELGRTISTETLTAVSNVLKPEQVTRLKQIELQQAGVSAFARAEVEKALALNDEQKAKLKVISDESSTKMRELRGARRGQGGERGTPPDQAKITALRKETDDKAQAVLTDDQKKTWKSITGDVFTLVPSPPRKKDD